MDWNDYDAALFDLDGVLTPTALVHMRAWAAMFNEYLASEGRPADYSDDDYFRYVDGKPRYDGVRSFLEARGIAADEDLVRRLGDRKNDDFEKILADEGVQPYPGSAALIDALVARGTALAVVSSSRNAPAVLEAAGMIHHFDVIVDGAVAQRDGLPGKPAPDTFLAAAERLGVAKERAVVFEDALSGVQAGAAGHFGLVVGVDRGAGAQALTQHGADVVVADLQELVPA